MPTEHKIILSNGVEVEFYPENNTLEQMIAIAKTPDFLSETEIMKTIGCYPPFNLLIYDDFLALGLYSDTKEVSVGVRDYLDSTLIDWVDMALSLRMHPVRVVEKTSKAGEMLLRLKPRLDLDWIEYDPQTQVVREIHGKPCPVDSFLEKSPLEKNLYALAEYQGKTEVVHMRINDRWSPLGQIGEVRGVKCEGQGKKFYDDSIETVEKRLKGENPRALVIREPLLYCSHVTSSKPFSCMAVKFERTYAKKIGMDVPNSLYGDNLPEFEGLPQN